MNGSDFTVDSLLAMLGGDGGNGGGTQEKIAFSRGDVAEQASVELFSKLSAEMDADEVLKQAAHAKLSGAIMSEAILEKLSAHFGPAVAKMAADAASNAVHEKIAALLPQVVAAVVPHAVQLTIEKLAIGTSTAMSGNLVSGKTNTMSATDQQLHNDDVGRGGAGQNRVAPFLHTAVTEGAQVSGGADPEGGAGTKPEGWEPIGKMSAARSKVAQFLLDAERERSSYLAKHASGKPEDFMKAKQSADAYMKDVEAKAGAFLKQAEMEADLARYQELEQKSATGMLSPEEQQELEALRNKLVAAAGAAGGGAPGGPPAGGPPPGSMGDGGAPMGSYGDGAPPAAEPKTAAEKFAAVQALIGRYLGKAA